MNVPGAEPANDPAVRAVAALDDDVRKRLYDCVRAVREPVTREQAAESVGISRKLAAFHLDKLVDIGLLRTRPVEGVRRVGRRPKAYEPTDMDVRVAIPARQYDELADLLIDAVLTEGSDENARQASLRIAHARGHALGAGMRERARPGRLGAERALTLAESALRQWGFEPYRPQPSCLRLRNCPFHPLAAKAPDLVCGINHAVLSGFLAGLDTTALDAVLEPRAGECCVELRPAGAAKEAET